jgi:cobalt/nickel transport system permease protein
MSRIDSAIREIRTVDAAASQKSLLGGVHPFVKLTLTLLYIAAVVSFDKYDLGGLAAMVIYPMVLMVVDGISLTKTLGRMKAVLLVLCAVGIANPFFDRQVLWTAGDLVVTGGVISMITLMLKGVFTVLAVYLLVSTTTMEAVCLGLRRLHLPKILVTLILLIDRYILVLLDEGQRMSQAYALRAPGQKGIAFRAWGPFIGQMLLRSMDRAQVLYESMTLRGFDGEYALPQPPVPAASWGYLILWTGALAVLRFVPVFALAGSVIL